MHALKLKILVLYVIILRVASRQQAIALIALKTDGNWIVSWARSDEVLVLIFVADAQKLFWEQA